MARVKVQIPVDQTVAPPVATPEEAVPAQPAVRRQVVTKNAIAIVVVVALVLVVLLTQFNDKKHLQNQLNKLSTAQTSNPESDTQKYNDAVSKLVEIPTGITPKVETPNDEKLNQLKQANSLYKGAKSGDIFLVYNNPDKSIFLVIYRQSNNKIVLAVLDTSQQTQTTKP